MFISWNYQNDKDIKLEYAYYEMKQTGKSPFKKGSVSDAKLKLFTLKKIVLELDSKKRTELSEKSKAQLNKICKGKNSLERLNFSTVDYYSYIRQSNLSLEPLQIEKYLVRGSTAIAPDGYYSW